MRLDQILHRQVRVARVFGIPVRIDYRWFIVFALSTWLLAANFQRGFWDVQLNDSAALVVGIVTTLLLFLSVFGHELSHALAAQGEGIEIEEIVLHPFGGLARLRREPDSPRAEFRIAVAGPAASFIFALLAFGAMSVARLGAWWVVWAVCAIIAGGNLMLAVFNLLPGYPLDGGRVMRSYLWHRSGQLDQATRTVSRYGQWIGLTVIVFGAYMAFVRGAYFMGFWSALVGLFLWDAARAVWRAHSQRHAHTVAEAMTAPFALEPDTLVSQFVDAILPQHRQETFPVARERRLHGILTLADLKALPREAWHRTRVGDVMRPVEPRLFVTPATPLGRAAELMRQNGAGALAVIDDAGELVGFLRSGRLKPRAAVK